MIKITACFSGLPIEIRLQIWEYCWFSQVVEACGVKRRPMAGASSSGSEAEIPEHLWLNSDDQARIFTYSTPRTPLHQICHESRRWVQDNDIHLIRADVSVERLKVDTLLDRDMVLAGRNARTKRQLFDTKNDVLFLQHAGFMFGSFVPYPKFNTFWDPEGDKLVMAKLRLACPSYTDFDNKCVWDLRLDPSFLELIRLQGPYEGFKPTSCLFSSIPDILDRIGPDVVKKARRIGMDVIDWRICVTQWDMGFSLSWLMEFKGLEEVLINADSGEDEEDDHSNEELTGMVLEQFEASHPDWKSPRIRFVRDLGVVATHTNLFLFRREAFRD